MKLCLEQLAHGLLGRHQSRHELTQVCHDPAQHVDELERHGRRCASGLGNAGLESQRTCVK